MKLFVGLGNPGAKYARNRHNIGFMAVEAVADAHGFSPWRSKFQGLIAEGRLGSEKVLLLKPETYMNLSGDSARAAVQFYKLGPEDVVAFHDELDLAPGKVRVKAGGGTAGHNGLRSLAAHLGPDFVRVRLGIGHPGDKRLVTNYVLGDFARADEEWLEPLLRSVAEAAPDLAAGEGGRFASRVGGALKSAGRPPEAQDARPRAEQATATARAEAGEETLAPDARNALQRLIDRFR